MADMHVLTGNGEHWNVIMHFAVPDVDNEVGVNYRDALISGRLGGTRMEVGAAPGKMSTAEKAQIDAGALYEHPACISVDGAGQSTNGRRALLRTRYAALKVSAITNLQAQLKFFGHTESEV